MDLDLGGESPSGGVVDGDRVGEAGIDCMESIVLEEGQLEGHIMVWWA